MTEKDWDKDNGGKRSWLFHCPEECGKSNQQCSSFEKQLDCNKHKYAVGHETLYDKTMILYAAKLERGTGVIPETIDGDVIISLEDEGPALLMVLALKSAIVTRKNLTATQKTYLSEVFQEKHTGQKANPVNIWKAKRKSQVQIVPVSWKGWLPHTSASSRTFSRLTAKTLAALAVKTLKDTMQTRKDIQELTEEASDEDFCSSASNHVSIQSCEKYKPYESLKYLGHPL